MSSSSSSLEEAYASAPISSSCDSHDARCSQNKASNRSSQAAFASALSPTGGGHAHAAAASLVPGPPGSPRRTVAASLVMTATAASVETKGAAAIRSEPVPASSPSFPSAAFTTASSNSFPLHRSGSSFSESRERTSARTPALPASEDNASSQSPGAADTTAASSAGDSALSRSPEASPSGRHFDPCARTMAAATSAAAASVGSAAIDSHADAATGAANRSQTQSPPSPVFASRSTAAATRHRWNATTRDAPAASNLPPLDPPRARSIARAASALHISPAATPSSGLALIVASTSHSARRSVSPSARAMHPGAHRSSTDARTSPALNAFGSSAPGARTIRP